MASREEDEEQLAFSAAYEDDTPTPLGWKRKLIPRIGKGLVPARTDVIFITPDGEEVTSRTKLQRYLKAHKGGPDLSEFIWLVDDAPRRSTRSRDMAPVKFSNIERSSKAAGKRKHSVEVSHEKPETGNRGHTVEADSHLKEPKRTSGKRTRNVRNAKSMGGKSGEKDFSASPMASVRRQRSPKVVKNRDKAAAGRKSARMDGEDQMISSFEKVEASMDASKLGEAEELLRGDAAQESQDKNAEEKMHVFEKENCGGDVREELDAVVGNE